MAAPLQKTPLLTEAAANLLITQFQNNFNLQLQQADNQYDDGINLEPVDDNSIHISDKIQSLDLPSFYVLFADHAFQYTENPNYLDSEDSVVLVVSAEDVGADSLTRKMWRYGRVLFGIFNLQQLTTDDQRLSIKTIPTRLGYSQPITTQLQKENQRFRMDTVLELKLMHFEKNLTN